jgi:hypothetical protein
MTNYCERLATIAPEVKFYAYPTQYTPNGTCICATIGEGEEQIGRAVALTENQVEAMTEATLGGICDRIAYSMVNYLETRHGPTGPVSL